MQKWVPIVLFLLAGAPPERPRHLCQKPPVTTHATATQLSLLQRASNHPCPALLSLAELATNNPAPKNSPAAAGAARRSLQRAKQPGANQTTRRRFTLSSRMDSLLRQQERTNRYQKTVAGLNDSVTTDAIISNLPVKPHEQRVAWLRKEKQIQQQPEQTSPQQTILVGSLTALLLFTGVGFGNSLLKRRQEAYRNKLAENEWQAQQFERDKARTELQIQALRTQMNPHFIFNSLNSINCFILNNDKEQASEHLTQFSKLIRLVMEFSQKNLVCLADELHCLKLYIQLEQLRFADPFTCEITCDENIDVEALLIPPLLLQPFVENAIWHGLMHKEGKGHLQIRLYKEACTLCCKITDNGIGRMQAAALKSGATFPHKSLGIQLTTNRIALLQKDPWPETGLTISDLVWPNGEPAGTEVLFKIPMQYD